MAEICEVNHLATCKHHYFIYECCGERAVGDYPWCPIHGGEPMLKCEADEVL